MPDPTLCKDVFPFVCQNPVCKQQYDEGGFKDVLSLWGLVYADCGDSIYQGITCPKCKKTSLLSFPRNNPMVDLRDFIISSNPNPSANTVEQVIERERGDIENGLLRFKCIPAWDDETVRYDDVAKAVVESTASYSAAPDIPYETQELGEAHRETSTVSCASDFPTPEVPYESDQEILDSHEALLEKSNGSDLTDYEVCDVPYKMNLEKLLTRLANENQTCTVRLRRLYPDIPKFRNLLTCMSPDMITEIEIYDDGTRVQRAEGNSPKKSLERKEAWIGLFEEAAGKSLKETVKSRLEPHGFSDFDDDTFDNIVNQHAFGLSRKYTEQLRQRSDQLGFEATIWDYLKEKVLPQLLYPICTEIALKDSRKEVLGWVNRIEPGKALFVDAPMGLGKTHSIIEALTENPDLSTVIFMPTNRLCEEIVTKLKIKIALKKGIHYWNYFEYEKGFLDSRLKRTFLQEEVYFANGINESECDWFDKIINRYRKNWIKKRDICDGCEKKADCRFISHLKWAQLSRIVVTTHAQYDHFYQHSGIRKWFKNGYDRKDEAVPRKAFIVDEDLVLSKCYQPIYLERKEMGDFTATFINFLSSLENRQTLQITQTRQTIQTLQPTHQPEVIEKLEKQEEQQVRDLKAIQKIHLAEIENKIHKLFSQSNMPRKTSVVPPVDPDFKFATVIKRKWNEIFPDQASIIPEYLDRSEIVGNHLELIESGLKLGVTVQRFGRRDRIYFPNAKTYDLSRLPPHVFFDGTMLDVKFLENKLKNVKFERMDIDIKPLWQLWVRQNKTTDLPKKTVKDDRHKVEQFVHKLLGELGTSRKYFFLTKKKIRETYLKDYLEKLKNAYPEFDYVLEYFGYLRGINDANECDVGVMLGSYNPSDAVEIAMALEFIQGKLPNEITATENNLWKWRYRNTVRRYEPDYSDVQDLADELRHNEHRQGIARTRYLFHDVDFYVVSKDHVCNYEPFAKVDPKPYGYDIFPPRPRRPDSKYEQVKEAVLDWLIEHNSTTVTEVTKVSRSCKTGIQRRHTVKNHLDEMCREGLLRRDGKKYKLPSDS